jgi:hypothetical protein
MANGPKARNGYISAYLKRKLGMTQRPTTAGQALFGDVDVTDRNGDKESRCNREGDTEAVGCPDDGGRA